MRRVALPMLLLVFASGVLFGQYAATLSEMVESEQLTVDQALWLVGSAAGSLGIGATPANARDRLSALEVRLPNRGGSEAPGFVTLGDLAFLLVRIEETSPGFWLGVAPGPYTAFRFLQNVGVIPAGATAAAVPAGGEATDIVRRYLAFARSGVSEAATSQTPASRDGFAWEVELELSSSVSLGDVRDIVETAPQELGADALLTREDLAANGGYTTQTAFRSRLQAGATAGWYRAGAAAELRLSIDLRAAPSGYWDQTSALLIPGPSGLRVLREAQRWGGGSLAANVGRLQVADPTGLVLSELVDGASFAIRWPGLFVSAAAGSTRLVDKYAFGPRRYSGDAAVYSSGTTYFAPTRLISLARLETLVGTHAAGVFAGYYDDLESGAASEIWHLGATGAGTVAGPLTYRVSAVTSLRVDASPGLLVTGDLAASLTPVPIELTAGVLYASGGAGIGTFDPVTPIPLGAVVALPASNLWRAHLDVAAPLGAGSRPATTTLETAAFFSADPPSGDPGWIGLETIAGIRYHLLPDLAVEARGGFATTPLGPTPYARIEGRIEL